MPLNYQPVMAAQPSTGNTWLFVAIAVAALAIVLAILALRNRQRGVSERADTQEQPPAAGTPEPPESESPAVEEADTPLPANMPPQFLEARSLDGARRRFPIEHTIITIGRSPTSDIVLGDEFAAEGVADHHARIRIRDPWIIIEASAPENLLMVNGRRTGRNVLRNGWQVNVGPVQMVFRTAGLGTAPLGELDTESRVPEAQEPAPAEENEFDLLPDGAMLRDRYVVIEGRAETPSMNSYLAQSSQPVLACMQCGYDANGPDRRNCRNCGASLANSLPYYPHLRVKESRQEQDLALERQLVGLSHPSALLPREAFAETPYSSLQRYYVISPEDPPQRAANLRVPQELTDVLEWTQQLALGMAYLHQNGISLGGIDPWRVALDGRQARWVDFSACEFVADGDKPERFAADVHALAGLSYYLLTGKREYDPTITLSPPGVAELYRQMLVEGITPTADHMSQALQAGLVEVRRPSSIDLRTGRLTDVGQVRQLNEDSILTIEVGQVLRSISEPLGLYVVCDGMGGHSAGDVASGLVVQTLARKALTEILNDGVNPSTEPNWESWLRAAVQEANQAVFGRRRASGNDMGTTCVAALVHCDMAHIANAGDSRCYLVNQDEIQQITTDHSLVQRLIQMRQLTPEEARIHPQRNMIYKNLGDKPTVEPDVFSHKLAAGDRLLLCSDGLSGMLEDADIHRIILEAQSPQEACRQLIQAANEAGGADNISAIIVQIEALE